MSNYSTNKQAIDKFRKELKAMLGDITEIDANCLDEAVDEGLADAKLNTPVLSGFMRKSWRTTPTSKTKNGVTKSIINIADYSSYVNYGHRIVNKEGQTVGWVKGQFMLEGAINVVEKALVREFEKEVERVNRKHDR